MKKFDKKNVENENHVLENIKSFEELIEEVGAASAIIEVLTEKIIVK